MIRIDRMSRQEVKRLLTPPDDVSLDAILLISHDIYVGQVDGEIACVWGLVPPSLMSTRAYLWLYTTPLLEPHKFLFIRHSQRWMEKALLEYETIVGFCKPENKSAIKWIEWLGGDFKRPFGERADFEIRKDHGRSGQLNRA